MTNGDKIRNMSDKQLSEFLRKTLGNCYNCGKSTDTGGAYNCKDQICVDVLDWLQKETSEVEMKIVEFTNEQFAELWRHLNGVCFSVKDCDECPLYTNEHMKCIMSVFDRYEDTESKTIEFTDKQFEILCAYFLSHGSFDKNHLVLNEAIDILLNSQELCIEEKDN